MAKNITYLLGAGASANALPIIDEINSRLEIFSNGLRKFNGLCESGHPDYASYLTPTINLIKKINWLKGEISNHQTVDTYARKLFSKQETHGRLKDLKTVLSTYFLFEQYSIDTNKYIRTTLEKDQKINIKKETPDKRYDSLIASIISHEINNKNLLGNIKILSWNYDSQLELAYKDFWGIQNLTETHTKLQVIPGKWLITNSRNQEIDIDNFSIIHLNGIAGFTDIIDTKKEKTNFDLSKSEASENNIMKLVVGYFDKIENPSKHGLRDLEALSYFNYSWESMTNNHDFTSPFSVQTKNNAIRIAEQTQVLVVIGYSFPIFNRKIDKMIIDKMSKLEKVYIQDKEPERIQDIMENAFDRFNKISLEHPNDDNTVKFSTSKSLAQFILPFEL